jgi:hypothetical protein
LFYRFARAASPDAKKQAHDSLSGTYFPFSLTFFLAMASVASGASVTAPITHLVSVEVIEGPISRRRIWTVVAVMWIEAVINGAVEVVGAVEPGAGSDEDATGEPLGSIIPVWGTVVWGVVEVAIRANWRCSDIDGNLSGCRAWDAQ